MTIGVRKEVAAGEKRVAIVPEHVPTLSKLGAGVLVERGAGKASGIPDQAYEQKGAQIGDRKSVFERSDLICAVRFAAAAGEAGTEEAGQVREGATVLGFLEPYASHETFSTLGRRGASALAMEKMPRITRAQSMDALSSMANLAGYKAALLAADALPKMFPMMMTAAGTIVPARVFIVGVGVAGLQAIATAKRLGAVVSAYDIRPAVKEQVESLGARFVEMELETEQAEGKGGYARQMDEAFYRKQRELMSTLLAESDAVITTAAVPGKPAPTLVTAEMLKGMKPGSVIVDLAAERGGNCEVSQAGQTVVEHGVTVIGPENVASSLAHNASHLYSRNVTSLVEALADEGTLSLDPEDEIVDATLVLHRGTVRDEVIRSGEQS